MTASHAQPHKINCIKSEKNTGITKYNSTATISFDFKVARNLP